MMVGVTAVSVRGWAEVMACFWGWSRGLAWGAICMMESSLMVSARALETPAFWAVVEAKLARVMVSSRESSVVEVVSVTEYFPVLRMAGRTSEVTHFLNFLAWGLREVRMSE